MLLFSIHSKKNIKMLPFFNPNAYHSQQLQQPNQTSSSTPQQQVMGPHNPLQMGGGAPNPHLNPFMPNQFLNNTGSSPGFNVSQQLPHFMPQNGLNPNQIFSQNSNLGQWNFPNPMQNMNMTMGMNINPFLGMGMSGFSPQDLSILAAAQLALMSANPVAHMGPQGPGNLGNMQGIGPPQAQLNRHMYNQAPAQVNLGNVTNNNQKGNWKNPHNKNYNQKHDSFHNRSGKGSFGSSKRGKVNQGESPNFFIPNTSKENQGQKKRSLALTYTDQEIKQWRDQRRKNFPSQATLQKKLADKITASEARDEAAKLRRQQLKEILAKQAELGCEVAEIPSSYFCDSEKQVYQKGVKRPFNKKERFQNKFNKRGRFRKNDNFSIRPESGNDDPSNECQQRDEFHQKQIPGNDRITRQDAARKKKPSLLQKLLSADIKREKHQLLQVFRFMVINSFFKECPEKVLRFPSVIIKDEDYESPMVEKEVNRGENDNESPTVEEKIVNNDNESPPMIEKKEVNVDGPSGSDDDDNEGVECNDGEENDSPRKQKESQEEEGEIID